MSNLQFTRCRVAEVENYLANVTALLHVLECFLDLRARENSGDWKGLNVSFAVEVHRQSK